MIVFNPVFIAKSEPYTATEECLCVTGSHSVQRYRHIRVRFHNLRFSMVTMDFEGMYARLSSMTWITATGF